jgi:hypothetical protein
LLIKQYLLILWQKRGYKMTQRDMAGYLGVSTATIRNWKKDKQNLYKIVMQGFAVEDVKKLLQESLEKLESAGEEKKK